MNITKLTTPVLSVLFTIAGCASNAVNKPAAGIGDDLVCRQKDTFFSGPRSFEVVKAGQDEPVYSMDSGRWIADLRNHFYIIGEIEGSDTEYMTVDLDKNHCEVYHFEGSTPVVDAGCKVTGPINLKLFP